MDIPEEDLEKIAGGGYWDLIPNCAKCNSPKTVRVSKTEYGCKDCGYRWPAPYSETEKIWE